MNETDKIVAQETERAAESPNSAAQPDAAVTAQQRKLERQDARRWWIRLFIQPMLLLLCGAILIIGLGFAQRYGFISSSSGVDQQSSTRAGDVGVQYICPMMCTPPQSEPGRCPVCAMELVQTVTGGGGVSRSIQIDPAARRVANIHTVAVQSLPMKRSVRAIGELNYDEGTLKTLSAYVDGRLDRLYADYTGVVVDKGDQLALVYAPKLYSSQVEMLLARKARDDSRSATLKRVHQSNRDLFESAKQRLIELGMTQRQIEQLEETGEASSRMHLVAPISGTVIEKFAVEGQYVKEGEPIYRLADLSTVWLMLELFPEDATTIRYGQKVEATVQSLPGRSFAGRVAFIDPNVSPKTRTVGVRVVIPNPNGLLRVGDYAKASIEVPLGGVVDQQRGIYDPELANKWISPRHPQVVRSSAGSCPFCGIDLVPAAKFGFLSEKVASDEALVVPRDAVLMAGDHSVVYVETKPGRFEIRRVVLGPTSGDQIVVLSGVEEDERVATRGNFLIDSQMQLAGNPSLIDPLKAETRTDSLDDEEERAIIAALANLTPEERAIAERQRICLVADHRLGAMGTPKRVDLNGTTVFICCEGCRATLLEEPDKYLEKLATAHRSAEMDLPPMGIPELVEPHSGLPPTEIPQAVVPTEVRDD